MVKRSGIEAFLDSFNKATAAFTRFMLRLLLIAWLVGLTYWGFQLKGQLDRQGEVLARHDLLIGQQAQSLDNLFTWSKDTTSFLKEQKQGMVDLLNSLMDSLRRLGQ